MINGDIEQPGLGISTEDREKLSEEVNIIFHGAATVKFDEKLRIAVGINVLGTREVLKLAKSVKNLKVPMPIFITFPVIFKLQTCFVDFILTTYIKIRFENAIDR